MGRQHPPHLVAAVGVGIVPETSIWPDKTEPPEMVVVMMAVMAKAWTVT